MNDTLKAAGRIGAELGAAKAENERLRGLLAEVAHCLRTSDEQPLYWEEEFASRIYRALSQQAEPTGTFTAVDMATAAAQGFRDGQAAVEPAPAQDGREVAATAPDRIYLVIGGECPSDARFSDLSDVTWCEDNIDGNGIEYVRTPLAKTDYTRIPDFTGKFFRADESRPAQTEQQPIAWADPSDLDRMEKHDWNCMTVWKDKQPFASEPLFLRAAPIAQTAPQPEQRGLVEALEYYANGDHLLLADPDAWDTCSGEPQNFLHDEAGTASVEDGTIAKVALEAYRAALSAVTAERDRLAEQASKFRLVERAMEALGCDEREGGIVTAASLILISSAHRMNAKRGVIDQEGVTLDDDCIGDWRVTIERISAAMAAKEA